MKTWLKENLISSLTLGAIVVAAVYYGEMKGLLHTSEPAVQQAEEYIEWAVENKDEAIGEYILDSIEQVETEQWRAVQMAKDSLYEAKLKGIDSLLRLNVRLTNETKKTSQDALEEYKETH